MEKETHPDAELIAELGGPAQLARLLGFTSKFGTQRVQNWISRGIPVRVKYDRPDLFDKRRDQKAA